MPLLGAPSFTVDDIDDLLYLTRVNEASELDQTISELTKKYNCSVADVITSGIDPDSGNTVLHFASANGFVDLVKTFTSQLASTPNTDGASVDRSSDSGHRSKFVNESNSEGNTALHWAAYNGQLNIVKALLEAGADMWIKNNAGHLAMFEAERAEKNDVVQHLLQAGGNQVERAGVEGQPSEADIADVDEDDDEVVVASSSGTTQQDRSMEGV
ncbi:ankyrin repeat-containing protein [Saxophila tyrrhenica]|uniref:Ankyrin repeat-containing protein n=1 Tax=Saxophila tyrrhenica TaxID=1690608 RepID=A0AAV9NYT8_9PEZI|nr:ankyrin repeat-containing protein [Saxophila tyrrhenica]